MKGRPRLPVEVKRLRGTYRSYDSEQQRVEQHLSNVLPKKKLRVPDTITNADVRKAYKQHIELLRSIGMEQAADSPLLEYAYFSLQTAWQYKDYIIENGIFDENYEQMFKMYTKAFNQYNSIVKDFFLTPNMRVKLKLNILSVAEKELDVTEKSLAMRLLEKKDS